MIVLFPDGLAVPIDNLVLLGQSWHSGEAISPSGDMPKNRVRFFREGRSMLAIDPTPFVEFDRPKHPESIPLVSVARGQRAGQRQTIISLRLSLALFLAACALICDSGKVAADSNAGKSKAESCIACHGENGISQTENTPSLAAQPDQFLQWQLVFFRAGARKNEVMVPIAEQLSNEDVRDLAAYFTSLKPSSSSAGETPDDRPELTEAGKQAAAVGRCAACHGDNFAGSKAVARIAGQREEYLLKALHDYKSGLRTGGGVAAMAEVAYPLRDEDIAALAHFLSRL
jgi:cytochrome c553